MTQPISYTIQTAAEATGLSIDTIRKAVRTGDLVASRPTVNNRQIAKDVILRAELERWLTSAAA
jgi:hypothetical protein